MNAFSLEIAVKSTIEEILCVSSAEINDNTTIEQLGFDSMDFLDFIYKLEEKIEKNIDVKKIEFKQIEKYTILELINELQKV